MQAVQTLVGLRLTRYSKATHSNLLHNKYKLNRPMTPGTVDRWQGRCMEITLL